MDLSAGEIRLFPFDFAPPGWLLCDGKEYAVNQYMVLYSIIGTTYGGTANGGFRVPDLRGRTPLHAGKSTDGANYPVGLASGEEKVTLTQAQMPGHNHQIHAVVQSADENDPVGRYLAKPVATGAAKPYPIYGAAGKDVISLGPDTITPAGAGAGHNNMQPYQVFSYCIAHSNSAP